MNVTTRLLTIALVLAAAAAVGLARPAAALAQGGDNVAVAVNTKDGSSIFRLAFSIKRVAGDVVDNGNAAVAYSSCTECQTVAVAIQVVLVMGDPSVVTPTNLAIAINDQCDLCTTVASAYQFVFGTGGPVHFTAEGNRELAAIRQELRELLRQNLGPVELQAGIEALMERLRQVIENELVAAGKSGDATGREEPEDGDEPVYTTPTEPPPPPTVPEGATTTTVPSETESTTESTESTTEEPATSAAEEPTTSTTP